MVTAKLIGESDGYEVSRDFQDEGYAIKWLRGAGLADFGDQTARGEVLLDDKLVWTRANLQTQDSRERDQKRYATRWHAGVYDMIRDNKS